MIQILLELSNVFYSMYSNQCFHIFMFFLSDDSSADVKQGVRKEGRKARKRDCYEPAPI